MMKIRFILGLLWVVTGLALVACSGQGAVETTAPTAEAQLPPATEAAGDQPGGSPGIYSGRSESRGQPIIDRFTAGRGHDGPGR